MATTSPLAPARKQTGERVKQSTHLRQAGWQSVGAGQSLLEPFHTIAAELNETTE
jgi:hypothetical protein